MKATLRPSLLVVLGIIVTLGIAVRMNAADDKKGDALSPARYTIVSTDGAHVIVTDNGTSKLYFYAIDKDAKIGDELKLRGTLDLHDVGKPSLKPTDVRPAK